MRPAVAEPPLRTPFVSQPVSDRGNARARAKQCAKELGASDVTPIRESMCSTFRADGAMLRVGHFTSDPSTAQRLATMLREAEFRVPDVIATWQQDDTGLGVIAYEVVQETGQATDWREVGRIIRRLHTDIAPSEIPTGYPIATPTHLPWWNFGAILTRLEATALVPSQQLSTLHEAAERGAEWTNIVETTPNVLTHGDIHPGNILMSEDGPTHQPVEQLASLRAMPDLHVVRPADANETSRAWDDAVSHDGPTAMILSRQDVRVVTDGSAITAGAGVVGDDTSDPDVILIGTGSEVSLCVDAAESLRASGRSVRVVSMPSWDRFRSQPVAVRNSILTPGVPSVSVEAASTFGWHEWSDRQVGIDRFGASAPGDVALDRLGINVDAVVATVDEMLGGGA